MGATDDEQTVAPRAARRQGGWPGRRAWPRGARPRRRRRAVVGSERRPRLDSPRARLL